MSFIDQMAGRKFFELPSQKLNVVKKDIDNYEKKQQEAMFYLTDENESKNLNVFY